MILLLGSSGLLGKKTIKALLERQLPLRVLVRGSEDWRSSPFSSLRSKGVEVVLGEMLEGDDLEEAMTGCDTVINTAGRLLASSREEAKKSNLDLTAQITELVSGLGVKRYLHVSCLGANGASDCQSLQLKWQAESLAQKGSAYWTIFRPSYLFGDSSCQLLKIIDPFLRFVPCLPVVGHGLNEIQPVSAQDVANCIVQSIYDRDCVGKIYELGGPKAVTMQELMEKARQELGLKGPTVNLPTDVSTKLHGAVAKAIPKHLQGSDALPLLCADLHAHENHLETKFGLKPINIEERLPKLLQPKSK